MTKLSGHAIKALEIIEPFHERTVAFGSTYGMSFAGYDVRLGKPTDCRPDWSEGLHIEAGFFCLGHTLEHITVPPGIVGFIYDKSTWARRGVALQNTVLEPGWYGHATLEISNHGRYGITIPWGAPIAQIMFERIEGQQVGTYTGKYQDQPARPVEAIDEEDYDGSTS